MALHLRADQDRTSNMFECLGVQLVTFSSYGIQMLLLSVCAMHIVRMACIASALFGPLSRNRSICAADKLQDIGDVSAGNRLTNKYMGMGNEMILFLAMLDRKC